MNVIEALRAAGYTVETFQFDGGQTYTISDPLRTGRKVRVTAEWGDSVIERVIDAMVPAGLFVPNNIMIAYQEGQR